MAKATETSSVEAFMDSLHTSSQVGPTFLGMVKTIPGNRKAVMFAHVGDCNSWTEIHTDALAEAKLLHKMSCGGHEHHVAQLTLKAPEGPAETAFASLAVMHKAMLQRLQAAAVSSSALASGAAPCPGGYVDEFGKIYCP